MMKGLSFRCLLLAPLVLASEARSQPGVAPGTESAVPAAVLKGPYLQDLAEDRVTIMWESSPETRSRVEYGPTAALGNVAEIDTLTDLHEVRLSGLSPNTSYHYRIVTDPISTEVNSFTTFDPDAESVHFCVVGDTQYVPAVIRAGLEQIRAEDPDFVVHTGDFTGLTDTRQDWTDLLFTPGAELLANCALFPTRGNHEGSDHYTRYFSLGRNSSDENFYSFDYSSLHLISLNTNQVHAVGSPQYEWFVADLEQAQDSAWTIVFHHHPCHSSGLYGPTQSVQDNLRPLYEQYGVDVVFNGHEHMYERSFKDGVTYVTSSGGGGDVRPGGEHVNPYTVRQVGNTHHYSDVTATLGSGENTLTCTTYDREGNVMDTFTLEDDPQRGVSVR